MTGLYAALAGLLALFAGAVTIWSKAKREAKIASRLRELEAERLTRERMDHAEVSTGDTDADRKWLRDRAK